MATGMEVVGPSETHTDQPPRQVQQQLLLLLLSRLPPTGSVHQYLTPPRRYASPNREVPSPAANGIAGAKRDLRCPSHDTTAHCLCAALCPKAAGVVPGCPGPSCHLPADTDQCQHGVLGTLEQLPHGVQVSQGVQLPQGMQLPHVPAPCPPSYGGGQQVITGMLVPHQPVGLGWWPRCSPCNPTDSCQLSVPARPGPPPPHGRTAQRCRALLCSIPCSAAPRSH